MSKICRFSDFAGNMFHDSEKIWLSQERRNIRRDNRHFDRETPLRCPCQEPDAKAAAASLSTHVAGAGTRPRTTTHHSFRRLATTHHSFLGSFSSVSKRNFASKYAFCSIFQNLQNFLAEFSKSCKILQKISDFWQKSGNFPKFCKILRKFEKVCKILQHFENSTRKFCRF